VQATIAPQDMQMIFDRYAAAWKARDPDGIAALHTPDTMFWLRLDRPPVTGRGQVRAAFAELFEQWPEFDFDTYGVRMGPDHWVLDWALTCVLTDADGIRHPARFDCVDIVVIDASGLVERKDTFVDFLQLQQALT
jgi:uncharacterized protein (TIGR02246 family)